MTEPTDREALVERMAEGIRVAWDADTDWNDDSGERLIKVLARAALAVVEAERDEPNEMGDALAGFGVENDLMVKGWHAYSITTPAGFLPHWQDYSKGWWDRAQVEAEQGTSQSVAEAREAVLRLAGHIPSLSFHLDALIAAVRAEECSLAYKNGYEWGKRDEAERYRTLIVAAKRTLDDIAGWLEAGDMLMATRVVEVNRAVLEALND